MADIDLSPYLPPRRGGRAARWVSAAEAVRAVPDRSRVFLMGNEMLADRLLSELDAAHGRYTRIEFCCASMTSRPEVFAHAGDPFWFFATHASPAYKYLWSTGTVEVVPARYSDQARMFAPDGPLPCGVALVQVSPPSPEGRVSLAPSLGGAAHVARTADLVIAQVNPQVPYTFGAGEMDVDEFDLLVEVDDPLPTRRRAGQANATALEIARLAAALVPDGATIQFGTGAIPDAILANLATRRGLRVHSGLLSEACIDLHEAGATEGVMVAAEIVTTPRLLSWLHRNPAVCLAPAAYTHGAGVLASLPHFVSLQSTIEVALDGSCNSEVANGRLMSAPGGAPDFAAAASMAAGGRSIMALPSTAGGGAISRVVERITPPNPVTLPAYFADIFVTEHGVAEVRGLGGARRAAAIRALADEAHRGALT
jgi:acetyl-CoA hydrolase